MASKTLRFFFLTSLVGILLSFSAFAVISPNLSVHQSGYDVLDRLEAFGCAEPMLRSIKPMSHLDLRETLIRREGIPCTAPEWLLRQGNAFATLPVPAEINLRFLSLLDDRTVFPGLEASVTPLIPFRSGLPFFNGPNIYAELSASGGTANDLGAAFGATVGFMSGLDNLQTLNGRFYLREGYVKFGYRTAEFTVGRQQLEFGNARHGDLALALNLNPLDAIRFSFRPQKIRGLEFLGAVAFDSWISKLGDSSFVSQSNLLGVSLGIRPAYWIEFALMEFFQFGGNLPASSQLSAGDFLSMLAYGDSPDLFLKRHRSMVSQVAVWLPQHWAKIYSQFLFDSLGDPGTWFSDDISTVTGLWVPNVTAGLDLRLEYVHTVSQAYRNLVWRQGFTNAGTLFGHPIGPGGHAGYFDVGFPALDGWRPQLALSFEARGQGLAPPSRAENRYNGGIGIIKQFDKTLFQGTITCAQIDNSNYVANVSSQECAGQAQMTYQL